MDQDPKMQGDNTPTNDQPEAAPPAEPIPTSESVAADVTVEAPTDLANHATTPTEPASVDFAPHMRAPDFVQEQPAPVPVATPKKKHTGVVVMVVILILLALTAGGLAVWYFLVYNNPENVAFDAVNNFLRQPSLLAQSGIRGTIKNEDGTSVWVMTSTDASTQGIENSSVTTIALSPQDVNGNALVEESYKIKLSNVFLEDGAIYFQVSDLMRELDRFFEDNKIDKRQFEEIPQLIYNMAETVDNEWWKIYLPDVVELFLPDNYARSYDEMYTCVMNVVKQDISGELANIYSQNRFIEVTRLNEPASLAGNSLYSAKLNHETLANFINSTKNSTTANGIYNCLNHYSESTGGNQSGQLSADSIDNISADDLSQYLPADLSIKLQISDFGHELTQIDIDNFTDSDLSFSAGFIYGKPAEIQAPENYRPITDLLEELTLIINATLENIFGGNYGDIDWSDDEDLWIYDEETDDWFYVDEDTEGIEET